MNGYEPIVSRMSAFPILTVKPMVMNVLKRLWLDERGVLLTSEFVLLATLLAIGMVTGIAALRQAVVNELADSAVAISAWDVSVQSGTPGLNANGGINTANVWTNGSNAGNPSQIQTAAQVFGTGS
jgi:Flp pilus assembly pilin Flp